MDLVWFLLVPRKVNKVYRLRNYLSLPLLVRHFVTKCVKIPHCKGLSQNKI